MPRTNRHRNQHNLDAIHHHQPPPSEAAGTSTTTRQPIKTNAKLLSFLLQALIMALILSLYFVFSSFTITILLFHLGLFGVAYHRRCSRRHSLHYLIDCDHAPPRLSSADLKKLPRTRFLAQEGGSEEETCAICLEDLVEEDWCRKLPDCKHVFHVCCVDRWLAKAIVCPVCRTTVRLAAEAEGVVGDR